MEITVEILNEASALNAGTHQKFETYFDGWKKYSPAEIVNGKIENLHSNDVWSALQQIKARLDFPQHRQQAIQELAEIATFQNQICKAAFESDSIAELLIFLSVYSAIINQYSYTGKSDLTINYFVEVNAIPEEKINSLIEKAFEFIKGFQMQLNLGADAPYHEKEAFTYYKEGISDWNLEKTYSLIRSIENGRGLIISYLVEKLFKFIYSLAPIKFAEFLRLKSEPHDFIAALQWMSKAELIGLSKFEFSNPWLLFEILRQLSDSQEKDVAPDEIKAGAAFLNQIYSISKEFYYQVLDYFRSDEIRNRSIGCHLSSLSDEALKEVIDRCFKFDKYAFNAKAKRGLLEDFTEKVDITKLRFFLSSIHDKWIIFLNSLEHDKDFHSIDLVLTDYADYILQYQIIQAEMHPLSPMIHNLVQDIMLINEKWFSSESARNNAFYISLSKLYILSFSTSHLIKQDILIDIGAWNNLYNNQIIKSVFLRRDKNDVMETINRNFLGLND
ncbi:MAG: hypothetical protein H3C64_07640 [Candidatus Kuenenia stuttgartiensis]|nr:hypothetical protein [Candidatus Kuenenia stuttgartiensis]